MKRTLWLNGLVILLLSGFSILTNQQARAEHIDLTNQLSVRQTNEQVVFRHFDGRHGLPDNEVWSIVEDRLGFMWFGTRYGGLARFDGHEFKIFEHVPNDSRSLVHNFVWTLLVDKSGTLWVGTNGGGLDRYDAESERFIHLGYDKEDSSRLPHANVKVLFEDSQGQLWVGTNGGLSLHDRVTDTFTTLSSEPDNPNSLSDNSVRAIAEERENGRLWLGTRRGGLNIYDPRHKTVLRYQNDPKNPSSLSNDSVEDIFQDRAGTFWIGTRNGLNRFNPNTNDFVRYRHDPNDPKSIAGNWVKKIHQDRKGRLWVGTLSGVSIFNPTDGTFEHVLGTRFGSGEKFRFGTNTIFEDKSGALWFGSSADGIALLNTQKPTFRILSSPPEISSGQPNINTTISAITVDAKGHTWVGYQGFGLGHQFGNRFQNFRHAGPEDQGLIDDRITTITTDKHNDLWIGTLSGISKFDGNQFVNFANASSFTGAVDSDHEITLNFPGNRISALFADQNDGLWFGVYGHSLNYFDGAKIKQFGFEGNRARTPPPLYPEFILPAEGEASVWVGTNNMGLGYADMAEGHVKPYLMSPNHPENAYHNKVRAGSRDSNGLLWLATNRGVYIFDPKKKKFTRNLTVTDGLPSNTIMSILVDHWDNVWIATKDGLSTFYPKDGSIRTFADRASLGGASFLPKISVKDENGNLYWGTSKGILTFLPERNQYVAKVPQVVLTEIQVLRKPLSETESYRPVTRPITKTDRVELEPGQNDFAFKFVAPSYTAPRNFSYSYILEGYDSSWHEAIGLARSAKYSNVPPGRYVFRVRAGTKVGEWDGSAAGVSVTIQPYWWQTIWFQGSLITVLLGLIATVYFVQGRISARFADLAKFPDQSPHPVMRFDPNDKLSYSNEASKILFEIGIIGPTNDPPKDWLPALSTVRESGKSRELNFPLPEKNRYLQLTFSPLHDSESVNVYGTDITDRVKSENALRQSQKLEAVGQLASGIAHDFNNLLTVVAGNLELLAENVRSDKTNGTLIEVVLGAVTSGSGLTQRLLKFSQEQPLNPLPIHVGEIVDRMQELLSRTLGEHIAIKIDYPEDLWHCQADASQLETSLLNLAINARDAMPSGGELTIEIENTEVDEKSADANKRSPGRYVRISLSDTGCGMSSDILERALDPFFTTKTKQRGSGLGLSMVYLFAEQSKGHLGIRSAPDKGTTVILDLPRSQNPAHSQSEISAEVTTSSNHKCRILVVEDDAQVRDLVVRLLRQSGHDVMAATNAVEALRLAESENQFDVLVSDVVLPNDMNGVELATILVGREPNLGVLLMSGHMDDATLATIKASPCRKFVQKPFRKIEFLQKIDDVIREMI